MNTAVLSPVPSTFSRYRWVVCSLLFLATSINYFDRQILALLKPILDKELGWSDTQYGWILSSFQASYALGLLFFGWFVDRYGSKLGYTVSILAWSLAAMGHALVGSIGGFFVARVALGAGESGNFPSGIKAATQWFPKEERALATSIFNSGANVGALLAPAVVPWVALNYGWHWAFVFAGIAGFLWLGLWWPLYHEPGHSASIAAADPDLTAAVVAAEQPRTSWQAVLGQREAWSFITSKFLTDPIWWFFLSWLPDYFNSSRGLDIKHSGPLLVTIYGIVTVLSITGGWFSGHLISQGWSVTRARKFSMLIFALCVVPVLAVTHLGNWEVVFVLGLAGAAHQAWSATIYTTVSDMFPTRTVATLIGIGGMAGSLSAIGFQPFVGWVLDHFKGPGYALIFGLCSGAYLLAFAINHWFAPSFEPVESH